MSKNWLPQEEEMLDQIVKRGEHCWMRIASLLNNEFPNRTRTPKQCRERYNDYISFKGKIMLKNDWGSEKEQEFWKYIQEYGLSWTKISRALVQKNANIITSSNNLKNKFYSSIKSMMHRVNAALGLKNSKNHIKWTPFRRFVCLNFYTRATEQNNNNYQLCWEIIKRSILKQFDMEKTFLQRISSEVYNFCKLNQHLKDHKLVVYKKNKRPVPLYQSSKQKKAGIMAETCSKDEIEVKIEKFSEAVDYQNKILPGQQYQIKRQEQFQHYYCPYLYPLIIYPRFVPLIYQREFFPEVATNNSNNPNNQKGQFLKEQAQEEVIKKEEIQKEKNEREVQEGIVVVGPNKSAKFVYNLKKQAN